MTQSSSKYGLLLAAIGSFLAWTDVFFVIHMLNRKRSTEWNCRLVTTLHAIVSTSLCFTSAVVTGPWPFTHIGIPNTSMHNMAMIISLGYFFFDFIWCLYMQSESKVMLAHHFVSILGLMYSLYSGKAGNELIAVMGASEITNPLLQLRWFLKETGFYNGRQAKIIDFIFVSMFWFFRLIVGSVFHYLCQTSPKLDLITRGGGQAFYIISLIFGVQLLMYYYKKYIKKKNM